MHRGENLRKCDQTDYASPLLLGIIPHKRKIYNLDRIYLSLPTPLTALLEFGATCYLIFSHHSMASSQVSRLFVRFLRRAENGLADINPYCCTLPLIVFFYSLVSSCVNTGSLSLGAEVSFRFPPCQESRIVGAVSPAGSRYKVSLTPPPRRIYFFSLKLFLI